MSVDITELEARRAIEALRSGVPNRDAVRHLASDQRHIEARFMELVANVGSEFHHDRQLPGILVVGDFGSGKSHLLERLHHVALEQNFASSKVVISKETPLSDLHRIYRAAVQELEVNMSRADGIAALTESLPHGGAWYGEFRRRVTDLGLDPQFSASIHLYEIARGDSELAATVRGFWSGDKANVSEWKRVLREARAPTYPVKSRKVSELAPERFRFIAELTRQAGYAGWVILLDELELVEQYSMLGRARAYWSLALLCGRRSAMPLPGILCVGAMTGDLTQRVFDVKRDDQLIQERLGPRLGEYLAGVEEGMELLRQQHDWALIEPLSPEAVRKTHALAKAIYEAAYGQPTVASEPELKEASEAMRRYMRRWITEWDLRRVVPGYEPDIETRDISPNRDEMRELERPAAGDDGAEDDG